VVFEDNVTKSNYLLFQSKAVSTDDDDDLVEVQLPPKKKRVAAKKVAAKKVLKHFGVLTMPKC